MSSLKFHVKRGDTVQVISGNQRGSSGRILKVLPDKAQVIIEGVRLIKKHQRKTQDNPEWRNHPARRSRSTFLT